MNVEIDGIVPVHLKNSNGPTDSGRIDANQLIKALTYCAFVEEQIKVRVPYALVIYAGQQVRKVEFTDARRQWLLQTINEVELARARLTVNRNHDHRGRCAGCGVRSQCDQALL